MIGTAGVDTKETLALRADMVADLIREGLLDDERWRPVFLAVPRHIFVPASYEGETRIEGEDRREQWLRPVYSDTALVTQRRHSIATSSGTTPSLITRMLHALEVEDGDRVLQLGTAPATPPPCSANASARATSPASTSSPNSPKRPGNGCGTAAITPP